MLQPLARLLAPPACVGCKKPGIVVCQNCIATAQRANVARRTQFPLTGLSAVFSYDGLGKQLVHRLKFERQREAAKVIAGLIIAALPHRDFDVVTTTPTATKRVRQRGFDHGKLLGLHVAHELRLPYRQLLFRRSQERQLGHSRVKRMEQARANYGTTANLAGQRVLLVDDVISTGATLATGAELLRQAGATQVWAAVLADNYSTKAAYKYRDDDVPSPPK
ncbi:ComF family protein [Patescibacteria group bacterium]|nr:MAG: ComF family protein [Patescibacteria group bacterium]